ncbi:helix-turn-helix domain-containing protein [Arthrospiribacter ruber]|uniref:Helix-turn-helix domain-containing protein n=1 Tax=Arthrospiribacter ruber TaxID=2487934 RepID=A0A951IVG7_9BACT|nr:helix-turn-helix domain-containing protein [Arthrospiribacter ruber]
MSAQYFQRFQYLDELIRKKATGPPKQLARRFGVSERTVYEYINVLRDLGAEISYCNTSESYYYKQRGEFCFQFRKIK